MIAQRYDQLEELRSINARSMSRLYRAFDTQGKQLVVIKTLKRHPSDLRRNQKLREMFEREITIALSLQHQHILHVIDHGTTTSAALKVALSPKQNSSLVTDYRSQLQDQGPLPFLVYPYMKDGSLNDLIQDLPPWQSWSLMQTAEIILQAASALHYMHIRSQPLVHWDVKPDNFLVSREGNPTRIAHLFLCDFGISRIQKSYADETSQAWGTPRYMAPEQFKKRVRCESDQYTLALMACYLLTGEYPLHASHTDDWPYVHTTATPRSPSAINPQRIQSREIDKIILKALQKDPEERFTSIWQFAKVLYDAIKQQDIAAQAQTVHVDIPTPTVSAQKPRFAPMPLHPPIDTDEYRLQVESLLPIVQQAAPVKSIWSNLPYATSRILREYELPARPHALCWSSDGDKLACFFLAHAPLILYKDGNLEVISTIQNGLLACWAPYGDILAGSRQDTASAVGRNTIFVIDIHSSVSKPLIISLPEPATINGLDWSAGEQLAIWAEGQQYIWLYSIPKTVFSAPSPPKPQQLPTNTMLPGRVGALRWSPDGSLLAAGGMNGTVMCWRKGTYDLLWHNSDTANQVYSLAWAPDNIHLAVAFKRRIVVWDVYQNQVQAEWKSLPMVPLMLSFSHDSQLIAASTTDYLIQGGIDEHARMVKQRGSLLALWSPMRPELATLDPEQDTKLVIWQK